MDFASLRAKLDNIAEELAQLPEQETVAIEEETIEEAHMMPKTLKCKECGDMLGNPTTDCPCDSQDPKGDNWIMVDVDNDGDMDMAVANEEETVEENSYNDYMKDLAAKEKAAGVADTFAGKAEQDYDALMKAYADKMNDKPSGKLDDPTTKIPQIPKKPSGKLDDPTTKIPQINVEEVEEAMVEIPVQELADIMQLAGYSDYAERIEEYANEPDEQYMDAEEQLIGLSGGLNGPKNMHTPAAGGDNPMDKEALKTVEETLYKSYKDFLEEEEINVKED